MWRCRDSTAVSPARSDGGQIGDDAEVGGELVRCEPIVRSNT